MDINDFKVHADLTGFMFNWCGEDENVITITLKNPKEDSKHNLTAEIMVYEFNAGVMIEGIRFNLTSATGRNSIVKKLGQNWSEIIEKVCAEALKRFRESAPAEELSTEGDIEPPEYLIYPLIPLKKPTIIFGEPGEGKSEIGILLSILMMLPWHDNPLGLVVPERSVIPLFLDYETDSEEVKWRLKCLQLGMDLPELFLNYKRSTIPLADDVERVQETMQKCKAGALIIDSLGAACGGDLKEAQIALAFSGALRKLDTTSIIIGQTSKGDGKKSVFGSTYFEYYARCVWELRGSQSEDKDELAVGLFNRKLNFARKHKPMGFKFTFNGNSTTVSRTDPSSIPELVEHMSVSQQIRQKLFKGALHPKELAEEIGVPPNTVYQTLNRFEGKLFVRVGDKWGLLAFK